MPVLCAGELFFQWNNVLSHPARALKEFLAQKSIQMNYNPHLFTSMGKVVFFLSPKIKNMLGLHLHLLG
jgi:hypothetical protein